MPAHAHSPDLDELQTQAQADASRLFGDGPVAAWDAPGPGMVQAPRRRRIGVALLVAIAALASVGSMAEHANPPGIAARAEDVPMPASPIGLPDVDVPGSPVVVHGGAALTPAAPPAAAQLTITHARGLWAIDAVHASRLDAARQLAALSGAPLPQAAALLDDLPPLELQWQGRDLGAAWQAVIGPEMNFALHCRRQQCRVWLLGRDGAPTPSARARELDDDVPEPPPPPPAAVGGALPDTAPQAPPPVDELHHG